LLHLFWDICHTFVLRYTRYHTGWCPRLRLLHLVYTHTRLFAHLRFAVLRFVAAFHFYGSTPLRLRRTACCAGCSAPYARLRTGCGTWFGLVTFPPLFLVTYPVHTPSVLRHSFFAVARVVYTFPCGLPRSLPVTVRTHLVVCYPSVVCCCPYGLHYFVAFGSLVAYAFYGLRTPHTCGLRGLQDAHFADTALYCAYAGCAHYAAAARYVSLHCTFNGCVYRFGCVRARALHTRTLPFPVLHWLVPRAHVTLFCTHYMVALRHVCLPRMIFFDTVTFARTLRLRGFAGYVGLRSIYCVWTRAGYGSG